jgi:hypothetical protein
MPEPSASDLIDISRTARLGRVTYQFLRRPNAIEIIRRREALRKEISDKLRQPQIEHEVPEVLLIQLRKLNQFPATDNRIVRRSASPWFKVEVARVYDRWLEIISKISMVHIEGRTARETTDANATIVEVIGRIPLERIAHIDWGSDPYYNAPRFYCRYGRSGPVDEVVLNEIRADGRRAPLFDVKFKPRRFPLHKRLKYGWQARRAQKALEASRGATS